MRPLIGSGDEVTIVPVCPEALEVGDIVLVEVAGSTYLHLVIAHDTTRRRVQIGNNWGRVNGWARYERVHGVCSEVAGTPRDSRARRDAPPAS